MADDREWVFPSPEEIDSAGPEVRAEVVGLLTAIAESEDDAERRRGELAFGIRLLAVNYELSPADYSRLLSYPAGDLRLVGLQAAFRDLARCHGEALWPAPKRPEKSWRRRFHVPSLTLLRRPREATRIR